MEQGSYNFVGNDYSILLPKLPSSTQCKDFGAEQRFHNFGPLNGNDVGVTKACHVGGGES